MRLRGDGEALARVREFLRGFPGLSAGPRDDAALRELFVLLFGYESLFVTME
ncbi:MAG: hypothetical protein FJ027_24905 [Candidatus Rokubacteria bacterium]|nr:hypothetical protein [Candidatus Rokubacteria bacterium]